MLNSLDPFDHCQGEAVHKLLTLASVDEGKIGDSLINMRNAMIHLLSTLSASLEEPKRTIFLINNYNHIVTVLDERGVTTDEISFFRAIHDTEVTKFIERELNKFFGSLIAFVQKCPKYSIYLYACTDHTFSDDSEIKAEESI